MLNLKYQKMLLRYESRWIYLTIFMPWLFLSSGVIKLYCAARLGHDINLKLMDVMTLWATGPQMNGLYTGRQVIAMSWVSDAFLYFGFAICFGIFAWGIFSSRKMNREIVAILKKHDECL